MQCGKNIVTNLLVKWHNQSVGCGGRGYNLNKIRSSFIARCARCRYLRGKVGEQKMANLPADMISTEPPFTTELKMFGPFMVKHYGKEMKRCGVMFTCLSSCAVQLEVVQNTETDSFIQALREFIACQGNTRLIRCDSGTNFVDAKSEHQRSLSEMEEDNITSLTEWWNLLGHIEEQSSFRKLHGRSLGAPDKISMCGTINITKTSPYKFEPRITNHATDRC